MLLLTQCHLDKLLLIIKIYSEICLSSEAYLMHLEADSCFF